jgi:hypothetical protein
MPAPQQVNSMFKAEGKHPQGLLLKALAARCHEVVASCGDCMETLTLAVMLGSLGVRDAGLWEALEAVFLERCAAQPHVTAHEVRAAVAAVCADVAPVASEVCAAQPHMTA